jgi:putative nucleotidyltransferase with HDIG domain
MTSPAPRISTADVASRMEAEVMRRVAADQLVLPVLPAVAARALSLLGRNDFSFAKVAELIETDPLLAARLLKLANSAAFAGAQRIESILACATRLGASELRVFLLESAARQVLESRDKSIAELCRGLWEHSLAVAVLARDLVKKSGGRAADEAYLGGLLHDVGKPVLAATLLDAEQRLLGSKTAVWLTPETWMRMVSTNHRRVGVTLADRWGLPEDVARAIRHCDQYDEAEPRSLANAVRFANALAKKADIFVGEMDPDETASLVFIGQQLFGLDDAAVATLLKTLRERINGRLG